MPGSGTTEFTIGAEASCTDGACGVVSRVVLDPVARVLTHLVVEPKHRFGLGKLVPLDLVDGSPDEIRLGCSLAEFDKLVDAEEVRFLPATSTYEGYGRSQVISWPYYGWGMGTGNSFDNISRRVTYDRLPLGEVAVRRGEPVHATDGEIGRVQGLVIDPRDHHVTHVLLQEGHLWGRKEVAIPINAVTGVGDGIRIKLSKKDVQNLPPVDIEHPDGWASHDRDKGAASDGS